MSKIYYNINESNYIYEFDDFKFYFSSSYYLNSFKNKKDEFIKERNNIIKDYYKMDNIDLTIMYLICLYKRIEKRGEKIEYKNKLINKDFYFKLEVNYGY